MDLKKAIILCAGYGKRVLPLTKTTPKPLLKINEVPLIEYSIKILAELGVKEIAINVHHLKDKIIDYLKSNYPQIKIFTEEKPNREKLNKDFLSIYKKVKKNKKYFFSIKDVILIEALYSEGFKMPKELDIKELSKNLTVPPNLNSLVEREEIGILMLKLVEIIGSDEVKNLDPETLYFIVNLLNKAKIKKIRNEILNLTLPLRV